MSTMRNSVMLIGRPGAEPEIKTLNNNKKARFSLAVTENRGMGQSGRTGRKTRDKRHTARH